MKPNKSKALKKINWNDEQTRISITVAVAVFVSIFCLAATKVLVSNGSYKRQVINARHQAIDGLKADITQAQNLVSQFQVFENKNNPKNIIGGANTTDETAVPPDGNNSRIVLDALPSSYDFPALLTSVAKILRDNNLGSQGISGSDQTTQNSTAPSAQPSPIPIPLTISGTGNYKTAQHLIKDLERSIRPFDVTNLSLQGTVGTLNVNVNVNTYYQPSKTLSITYMEVK